MLTILAVIARIVTNPLSNVFQKQLAQRSADPLFIIAATHGLLTVLGLPLLLGKPLDALGVVFWASMLTAVVLAVVGNVILVYALRAADLSVLGPLNGYKAVLSLMLAVVVCVKFWMAPFVVAYARRIGFGMSELIEAVLTMALPGFMCGTAALDR